MPGRAPSTSAGGLEWVTTVMDATRSASVAGAHRPAATETFAVVPPAGSPKLLVPLRSRRAGARSVRTRDFGARRAERIGRGMLEVALRAGVAQPLLRRRATIRSDLAAHLSAALGEDDVQLAIRIGRPRPNSKPLVTVLDRAGRVLGYAKLGWNAPTSTLVRREAEVLEGLAARAPDIPRVEVPRLVHFGRCGAVDVLVVSPLDTVAWRPVHTGATVAALAEIAALRPPATAVLGASLYWRRQLDRAAGGPAAVQALALRVEQRHGERVLAFGQVHGDWTPWNLGATDAGLAVWDWERAVCDGPAGLDAAHFDLQLTAARAGRGPAHAATLVLTSGGHMLARTAPRPDDLAGLMALDVLEMALRHVEGGDGAMTPMLSAHLDALEALL